MTGVTEQRNKDGHQLDYRKTVKLENIIRRLQKWNAAKSEHRTLTIASVTAVALGYCLVGRLSLLLAVPPGYATAIWPAAGLALAATLIFGSRIWPAIFVGSLAVNIWASFDGVAAGEPKIIAAAVLIAFGASLQAICSAWLLRRCRVWPEALQDGRTVARLIFLGGPVGALINASLGTTTLLAMGIIDPNEAAFNWMSWWVGDAIGVVIMTPLLLIWSGSMGRFWRRRAATISIPSGIALSVVIALFLFASDREQTRIESDFQDLTINVDDAIIKKLDSIIASLGGVQSLFASSQSVNSDEFRKFTRRALDEHPALLALSWNRLIPHAHRAAYEDAAAPDNRLQFVDRNARGELVRAGIRDSYTIVQFIEPLEDNRGALGLDVASGASRQVAIHRARDTALASATGPLHLVQADHSEHGMLIFAPIFSPGNIPLTVAERRDKIAGYAVGVVLLRQLLESTLGGLRLDGISLKLYDDTDPAGSELLTDWGALPDSQAMMTTSRRVEFAGREWRFDIDASAEYVAMHRAPGHAMILAFGLLLCGLLGAFNLTLAGNERREALRAAQDSLTGIANRSEFERRVNNALLSCKKTGAEHALAFCDLDKFKLVNDTAGHQAGDELLKIVSSLLQARLRNRDAVARLGGDEFGVLLEHCPIDMASDIAQQLCADVRSLRFEWQGQTFQIGASIGVIALTAKTDDLADVMTRADAACYTAKDNGRNRVHVDRLDCAQVRRRKSELQRVADIRETLKDDGFLLYKQPIWALNRLEDAPAAVEILIRLAGPDGEVLTPAGMIAVAEQYRIMNDIDRWVIARTFQEGEKLCANGTSININLSANSFDDETMVEFVCAEIEKHSINARQVCFEITETAAISNLDSAMRFMTQMKDLGCRFALDDFGAGISSFRYLKTLPVDLLKIDGSLIHSILADEEAHAMVRAIQQIADAMKIATVAEWVSDPALIPALREIGVKYVQGFALGRPVPSDKSIEYIQSKQSPAPETRLSIC